MSTPTRRDTHTGAERADWSGRRDSNPRPQPWQGCALPLSYTRILTGSGLSAAPPMPNGRAESNRFGQLTASQLKESLSRKQQATHRYVPGGRASFRDMGEPQAAAAIFGSRRADAWGLEFIEVPALGRQSVPEGPVHGHRRPERRRSALRLTRQSALLLWRTTGRKILS